MPGLLACLEVMAGPQFNMVHVHGAEVHADLFARLPGATVHYDMWADNPPPQRFLDAGCAVATGPSPALLASDAPDHEVASACTELLRLSGRTILSPGCSLPLSVTAERMDLISAIARYVYAA